MTRHASSTKAGPGRFHKSGYKRGKLGNDPTGSWSGLHTNPARNAERKLTKLIGIRQVKRQRRAQEAA